MITVVNPDTVGLSLNRLARVTHWLENLIHSERLAGASVLINRRGRVGYFESKGFADIQQSKPFDQETIVRIYSMSKPITTVAAMMLYEEGTFQLDDPVAKYLPEFKNTRVWAGGDAPVDQTMEMESAMTVRHLMTHTSGLTYGFMQANVVDALYRKENILVDKTQNLAIEVKRIAAIPLICQPGSQWNYSVSTDVLGRLVEVWSGESFDKFLKKNVFNPLQMKDTGFHVQPENHSRFAALYEPLSGGELSNAGRMPANPLEEKPGGFRLQEKSTESIFLTAPSVFSGGGGLTSSITDYARFCQMLMNEGELDGERLLGRKTVQYMRQNHLPNNRDMAAMGQPVWSETTYEGIGFGLGFAIVVDPVKAQIITSVGEHHWGGAASTFFWLDPQEELFVIFFAQLIPSSTYPIRRELRTRVYQALID